ncbi:MAG: response regulator [Sideroxydans sp.]|jgi:DNA-binding response OmpR family regulator
MTTTVDILNARILVVDDMRPMVVLLQRILRSAGYVDISTTTDPDIVCELHRQYRYDLILLDLEMPVMDGLQVLQALQREETALPAVIVISAHPDKKIQVFQAGAKDYISKPFELSEVLARVQNTLQAQLLQAETQNKISVLEQQLNEINSQSTEPRT